MTPDWVPYDSALISEVAANLDLRRPNELGLVAVAEAVTRGDGREVVCDLATGVGKTYLAAGLVEYLARSGVRNILFVTPGTTIYDKTIANFTPGSTKFVAGLTVDPVLITADNFARGQVGDALHDPTRVKLFVFNVQQLIRPTAKTSRRTRRDDEYIGGALYDHLRDAQDLVIIADEHHVYRRSAKAFSAAIRDLAPRALVGLTATPDDADRDKVVFRYTLAEAIRDRLVKIPVIVYRQDGLKDWDTQLADACQLRSGKERVWHAFADAAGRERVAPVLFVVCQEIKDAEKAANILATHLTGDGDVLVITSQSSDDALAALAAVEAPESPVRAIVSVDKLREGWDVRNIGVIVGLRRLASETLTEQILGRGLRLPFGHRVGIGAVDQVDIVAHESYTTLLRNKDVLLERLRPAPTPWPAGVSHPAAPASQPSLFEPVPGAGFTVTTPEASLDGLTDEDLLLARSYMDNAASLRRDADSVGDVMHPQPGAPAVVFPRRERRMQPQPFSLSVIDGDDVLREGRLFAANLDVPLTRRALDARVGVDGEVVGIVDTAVEDASGTQRFVSAEHVHRDLVARITALPLVQSSYPEHAYAIELVDAFLQGAGVHGDDDADWTEPRARGAASALTKIIEMGYARTVREIRYEWHPQTLTGEVPEPPVVRKRYDWRGKEDWYGPWDKNVVGAARFDSKTGEYALAQKIDTDSTVRWWMRLYTNGQAWIGRPTGNRYFPDFIVIDAANVHWLVEAKSDTAAESDADVAAKRSEAEEWAAAVRATHRFGTWRYLFVTETEIRRAPSWAALTRQALH